jgi:hypothetical protein
LKEKIGKFMERKERNAEGKTTLLPVPQKNGPKNVFLGIY